MKASIEAHQAGEKTLGFTVIAKEIWKMAIPINESIEGMKDILINMVEVQVIQIQAGTKVPA